MCNEDLQEAKRKLERLEDLQKIYTLWFRLKNKLLPSNCLREVVGVDLLALDADVTGCVHNFIESEELRQDQLDYLTRTEAKLEEVVAELDGYAFWYYGQLKKVTSAILEYKERWGIPIAPTNSSI